MLTQGKKTPLMVADYTTENHAGIGSGEKMREKERRKKDIPVENDRRKEERRGKKRPNEIWHRIILPELMKEIGMLPKE